MPPSGGGLDDRVDEGDQGDDGQGGAAKVQPGGGAVGRLRDDQYGADDREGGEGDVEAEDGPPGEELQQRACAQHAEHRGTASNRGPDADRLGALGRRGWSTR